MGYATIVSFLSRSFSFVYSVYIYLVPTIARLGMASKCRGYNRKQESAVSNGVYRLNNKQIYVCVYIYIYIYIYNFRNEL